jgi:hypothetical protein
MKDIYNEKSMQAWKKRMEKKTYLKMSDDWYNRLVRYTYIGNIITVEEIEKKAGGIISKKRMNEMMSKNGYKKITKNTYKKISDTEILMYRKPVDVDNEYLKNRIYTKVKDIVISNHDIKVKIGFNTSLESIREAMLSLGYEWDSRSKRWRM